MPLFLSIFRTIEKYYWVCYLAAIFGGLFLHRVGVIFIPYILPILMAVLFFSFLKIEFSEFRRVTDHLWLFIFSIFVKIIFLPILVFFTTKWLLPKYSLTLFFLSAMPSGLALPPNADILKGNISLAFMITVASSLLCPFTIPFLFVLFVRQEIDVDIFLLMKTLVFTIFIPVCVAILVRKFFPKPISASKPAFTGINLMLLFFAGFAGISSQHQKIFASFTQNFVLILCIFLFCGLLYGIGMLIYSRVRDAKNRLTLTISLPYLNNSLAVALSLKFLGANEILGAVLYDIPGRLFFIVFKRFTDRKRAKTALHASEA